MKPLLLLITTFFIYLFCKEPAKDRLLFTDQATAVQDSMAVLQHICASIQPGKATNCIVEGDDQTLVFDSRSLGKVDTISAANKGFKGLDKEKVNHLLSTLSFLNRNSISGIYQDTATQLWLYAYHTSDSVNDLYAVRNICLLNQAKDTLSTAFNYYFKIIDRNDKMVLLSTNDVRYKNFNK